ncbi:hypothetical protein JIG36_27580 [Actinoplanes sp. LDG1-06]|uniref:DUF6603 domain-containing protein n=1 Tax=Paractinoplanes ovalisporus TaxID=2810368 RepID=A0ABS2AHI9_9ACTN|nr:DUF6603 domain-containing protein [Actinoplanes ovalisporus]MBM2619318.1 hypothetical protein [Actinoplanes ovalisporus]
MSDSFQALARHLALAVGPLARDFRDAESFRLLMWRLGWDVQGIPPSYAAIADAAAGLVAAADALADDAGAEQVLEVVAAAGEVYRAVGALTVAPTGMDPAALPLLARNLFEYLLADYLNLQAPKAFSVLELLGVIRFEAVEAAGSRPAFLRTRFEWERLPAALSDPASIPATVLGWGTADFDFAKVAELLGELTLALGLPSSVDRIGTDFADAVQGQATGEPAAPLRLGLSVPFFDLPIGGQYADVGLLLTELPAEGSARPGLLLVPLLPDGVAVEVELDSRWTFALRAGTDLATQLGVVVRPGEVALRYPFAPGHPPPSAAYGFSLTFTPETPAVLLGQPDGIRVELAGATLSLGITAHGSTVEVTLAAEPHGLALVLSGAGLDSFLGQLLGDSETRVELPIGVSWNSRTGLDFRAGAGLELSFEPQLDLGVLRFDRIDLGVSLKAGGGTAPQLDLRGAVALSGALGPVRYAVDRLGVHLPVTFEPGNAGPFDLDFGMLWPRGIALSVDAGAVVGGGFLFFDPEKGQYAGGLHLEFEKITLNAVGLLTTHLPDGSRGWSLLVIVQASGFTPIQLGFGFSLTGIGGLLGINRTVSVDVLRAGLRNRTLDSILFSPDDPTPRAPQIISTLQSVFPPATNQYVFGPMAQISWGAPLPLLTIELALILELPAPVRLILLGRVRAALPDPDFAIVEINLDVIGVIDFDRSELSVDATLFDSRIGQFALSGDMAARVNWGARPEFALSVGGFHPAYKPPPGFPALRRLALALSTGDNPKLRMELYLALTANTVQAGARLELYVGVGGFSLEGSLGFDALIQFSPFRLLAEIRAHLALKRGSRTLMGLDIEVNLTGPGPWVLWGKAKFKIFFFTISLPFRARFGRDEDVPAIEPQDVWPVLRDSLAADASWSAQLPPASGRLVVLRDGAGAGELSAHPLGVLSVSQGLVPLQRTLGLFGSVPPRDFDRFAIVSGHGLAVTGATTDFFAPAQFRRMSDPEKLASPAFERMVSGARFAPATAIAHGFVQETPLDYEQSVILDVDAPPDGRLDERYTPAGDVVAALAEHGPAGTATLRAQGRAKFAPAETGPAVADPVYVVVDRDTLTPQPLDGLDGTWSAAAERLRAHPDRDELQIVRKEELTTA